MAAATRGSWWSITINNPTQTDRDALKSPPSFVKLVKYQDEVGDEGTPHIQGCVNTAQVRFSQVKAWLERAHIEVARDKNALLKYVEKEDTAVAGTRVEERGDFYSMADALKYIGSKVDKVRYNEWLYTNDHTPQEIKSYKKVEFWSAVEDILKEKPNLVGLLTNPQLERAWVNTRSVWVQ